MTDAGRRSAEPSVRSDPSANGATVQVVPLFTTFGAWQTTPKIGLMVIVSRHCAYRATTERQQMESKYL